MKKRIKTIVKKPVLFIIFLIMMVSNFSLVVLSFFIYLFIYIKKIISSKLPFDFSDKFSCESPTFRKFESSELKMDIWFPNQNKEKFPVVFFAHGGGWISGYRRQPNNISWCKFLASKGFIAVSIDYRLGLNNNIKDIMSDYEEGLNFIKINHEKYKMDIDNIILMGLSAGGHLALMYAAYNSFMNDKSKMSGIKGICAYYSPSDLKDIFSHENPSLFAKFSALTTFDGTPQSNTEAYNYFSPINWISENMIPTLLIHGKEDETVPFESSVKLARKLKDFNVKYDFLVHKNADHCFEFELSDFRTIKILEKTVKFMKGLIK